jgi:hypothetical protein
MEFSSKLPGSVPFSVNLGGGSISVKSPVGRQQ